MTGPPWPLFEASAVFSDCGVIVRLSGEIDCASVENLSTLMCDVLATKPEAVIVDLSAVTFMDPAGIRPITTAAHHAGPGIVRLRHPVPQVRRFIELIGLDFLIDR